jgi:hypothetical protein
MEPRGPEGTTEGRDGGIRQHDDFGVIYHIGACVTTDRDVTVTQVTTCRSDFNITHLFIYLAHTDIQSGPARTRQIDR